MKIKPLISIFQQIIPKFSDKFSDNFAVSSGNIVSGLVTLTTSEAHNLKNNEYIAVYDSFLPVKITSFIIADNVAIIETSSDHGLSLSMNYKDQTTNLTVDLQQFTDTALNGTFSLLSVPNRTKFTIYITLADGTYTANGYIINYANNIINGVHQVTVIDDTNFSYQLGDTSISVDIYGSPFISSKYRISGANDIIRANASYTKQTAGKYWLFITYGSSTTSKDRNILNDSTNTMTSHSEYRLRLIEDFDINIFVPVANQLTALDARDNIEDAKIAIFKTILRFRQIQEYNADEGYQYTYINDFQVEANDAYIIHGYKFGTVYDITIGDTAKYGEFSPFRDLDLSIQINNDNINNSINLDEEIEG